MQLRCPITSNMIPVMETYLLHPIEPLSAATERPVLTRLGTHGG